jgi:type II secretion system protein H
MLSGMNVTKRIAGQEAIHGFTLIEILIVIMLISILSLAVMPEIQSLVRESKLNGATGELVTALECAADFAVTFQRPFGVKATSGSTSFSVFDARYKSDPVAHSNETPPVAAFGVVLNPIDKQWYTLDFRTLPNLSGVRISAAPASGELVFYPAGHCSALTSTFVVSSGTNAKTVTVNGVTGRLVVQ